MVSVGEQDILGENVARSVSSGRNTTARQRCAARAADRAVRSFLWLSSAAICSTLPSRCGNGWCESTICGERTGAMIVLEIPLDVFLFVRRQASPLSVGADRSHLVCCPHRRTLRHDVHRAAQPPCRSDRSCSLAVRPDLLSVCVLVHGGHVAQAADADHEELI